MEGAWVRDRDFLFGLAGNTENQLAGHRLKKQKNSILGKIAKEPSWVWKSSRER